MTGQNRHCPKCGAELKETFTDTSGRKMGYRYACYTAVWDDGAISGEGVPCLRRQVAQAVERAERAERKIEELADFIAAVFCAIEWHLDGQGIDEESTPFHELRKKGRVLLGGDPDKRLAVYPPGSGRKPEVLDA